MNFTIARDKLLFLLQTVLRAIPPKSTISAIKGCLIEATSDTVTFCGTNLDWGVKISSQAGVLSSGSVVISARILDDIVRTISSSDVTLSLDESAWSLSLQSGSSHMVLNALPPDDFPKWPDPPSNDRLVVPAETFANLVRSGATSAVNNPARPLWGACLLEVKDNYLTMVSTDQFALSRSRTRLKARDQKAIVPADVLQDVARLLLSSDAKDMSIQITPNHIYFSAENLSCFSRLIEGQYYAYEQVIPKTFTSQATVGTQLLAGAAQRAAIVASEEDKAMRIIIDSQKGIVNVKAGSPEKGKMDETLPASISGESVEVWVQHKYVLQALSRISTEETFLGITGQVKPMKIQPVYADNAEIDDVFVIMPMSPKGAF